MKANNHIKRSLQGLLMVGLGLSLMGNEGCEEAPKARELKRRIQMGTVEAPKMNLPDGGVFDFKFAATAQMAQVLSSTDSFSYVNQLDPGFINLNDMSKEEKAAFERCGEDPEEFMKTSRTAACMIRMPQARLSTNIISFELTNKFGLTLGADAFGGFSSGVEFSKSKMTIAMNATHPLIDGLEIASTRKQATQTETKLGFSIPLGGLSIGPSAYFKTPLADVVYKGMQKSVLDLKNQWNSSEKWSAMVLKNCDDAIWINAGSKSDVGLVEGDVFEVYNVYYEWAGEVCDSELRGVMKSTAKPIALVQVEIVGNTFSQARIIESTGEPILPGARVEVRKLYDPVYDAWLAEQEAKKNK